jgi:hypothetical protein
MSWRRGLQFELCGCIECHDRVCEETPYLFPSMFGRALCQLLGHKFGRVRGGVENEVDQRERARTIDENARVYVCARRCGYVFQEDLPRARLIP